MSKACWIDSGDQFRKKAEEIEDPREALEVFKHSIQNYGKGESEELKIKSLIEAADKFNKNANEVEKSKKNLVLAIDGYVQAAALYRATDLGEKTEALINKTNELCEFIGMPLEEITKYLKSQGINAISI